jgi:hypothetical protein
MMSNEISVNSIDGNYPVPGVDNNSQGFRDNFTIIKNNFGAVKNRIEVLENTAVKISAEESIDFLGTDILNPNIVNSSRTVNASNISGVSADVDLSWEDGDIYAIRALGDITVDLAGFPLDRYASIKLVLFADGTARTVSFTSIGLIKDQDNGDAFSSVVVTSNAMPTVIDLWSHDGGNVVYASYTGKYVDITVLKSLADASTTFEEFKTAISNL